MRDVVADMRARRALNLARSPGLSLPLDVPTHDGLESVAHPSLVYVPEGWNGYKYHLFYTPYPNDDREDITYAVSNDLSEWVSPMGDDPRIWTLAQAQAMGAGYNSDPHALLVDGVMHVYHRPVSGSTCDIILSTSPDGITWSHQVVIADAVTNDLLSPAVVRVDADTWHMFSVKQGSDATARVIERRDSADGRAWGAPVAVTIPEGINPWHLDVQFVAGRFYALISGNFPPETTGMRLFYLTSDDGATFAGSATLAIPPSGLGPDTDGHYRSCLVPVPGTPLAWDVLVNAIPADFNPAPPTNFEEAPWRFVLHRNLNLDIGFPTLVKATQDELVAAKDRIFIGAERLRPRTGVTLTEIGAFVPVLSYASSGSPGAQALLRLPDDWQKFTARLLWTNGGAGAGDVVWRVYRTFYREGGDLSSALLSASQDVVATAGTQNAMVFSSVAALSNSDSGVGGVPHLTALLIQRRADDANDTLANAALLVGVELTKAS